MVNKRKILNLTIVIFGILILVMTIGYANYSSNLNINGVTELKAAKWDVHFENISDDTSNLSASSSGSATLESATKITFTAALEVNSIYSFTADIVNAGTFDAKLDNISVTGSKSSYDSDTNSYGSASVISLDYNSTSGVIYANEYFKVTCKYDDDISTSGLNLNDQLLKVGSTSSVRKIKVSVEYKQDENDTSGVNLPSIDEKYTFNLSLVYVQN